MDFFEKLGDAISGTGRDVSKKVTNVTEITKIQVDIRSKEETVRKQFIEIGKQYYELHKDDEEPLFEEITLIREALEKIEELKNEVAQRKGKQICPVCGAANEADALYCNKCGAKCGAVYTGEDESAEEVEEVEEAENKEVQASEENKQSV